jgi:hypothetical protein
MFAQLHALQTPTLALTVLALAGCTQSLPPYEAGVTAADFVEGITHPFLPMPVGAQWTYDATTDGEPERVEIRVLPDQRTIMGVEATVVRDTVTVNGQVKEDTFDWFAQDRRGNVWYLGEDTTEYENGQAVSKEGSWEWGKDGAQAGIIMKADPRPDNEPYFQEYYPGHAVDEGAVVARNRTIDVPAGSYQDTVTTKEWTRLEADVVEEANYARGVGMVLKEGVKGSEAREVLVSYSLA